MIERRFPIQRYGTIPWALAETAFREYNKRWPDQTLVRLAQRGGFGVAEMDEFVPTWREDAERIDSGLERAVHLIRRWGGLCDIEADHPLVRDTEEFIRKVLR